MIHMGDKYYLQLKDIKLYRTANFNITAYVKSGDLVYLTGPNGAGKTALLDRIIGIDRGIGGGIFKAIPSIFMFMVSSDFYFPMPIKVKDLVVFIYNLQSGCTAPAFNDLLLEFPNWIAIIVYDIKDRYFSSCSSGEKAIIILGIAFSMENKKMLLFDEPDSHLSKENRSELRNSIREYTARGKAIIMTTHTDYDLLQDSVVWRINENEFSVMRRDNAD